MKRAKTSKAWMKEHVNDFFVKQSKKEGYRSRAAYKLLEIAERDHLFKSGMIVVDLGAAPGSWSQVASQKVGQKGKVIALDILEMAPLPGVAFIQDDFREERALFELRKHLEERQPDLVISDMAPNMSGIVVSDQARSMYLAELALAFSMEQLNYGGNFLVKVFQGRDFEQFHRDMRTGFKSVVVRKPEASRDRSNELYLLGLGKK
ncbi:RlmE family RNA methyltransferase [Nitrosomonas oligotropha]|uniref:Ribosomal RNA large subunit methyltransferase E n=1 Tax=Nitrosomonas oligotropha TaxID=42354 RepID=A0A1H8LBA3_9PROT|nr:RlmE family RNA methyltransferase [Nitrosomonas oligotropha]MBX9636493.1 RlmE family RNA methyltransferase [Nitrosomonas sp.]TXI30680.1 MAG: RlmE family RNA methyltransferase [Nitrosomonas oligotropha]SDW21591.1 23S rRNA Um-2552 2'-O-methyltransferase [Nitrosomonas oligotropha]SEO02452.1 23S rRNA Um-2552 2'-O-methyltransferase [Nitrosomonas oligotropha]